MKLSIITINLNNVIGLRKTIESVSSQTSDNYEHIIIDGGSTDGSVDIIKQFLENEEYARHVTFWCSEKDSGVYEAMNKGIDKASGDYCLMLNSGDYFYDCNVLKMINMLKFDEDIVYFNVLMRKNNKEIIYKYPDELNENLIVGSRFMVNHQSMLIKISLQKSNYYNINYRIVSDYEFFIKAILEIKCSYRHIDSIMCSVDFETGISSTNIELRDEEMVDVVFNYLTKKISTDKKLVYLYYDYNYGYGGLIRVFRKILNFVSRKTFRKNFKAFDKWEAELK